MPPKLESKEEALTKRRLTQKMCKIRRYMEIKNDPELLEIEKSKRRERYLKQKAAKKKKSLHDLRVQRQKWREHSKRYREKKKESTLGKKELFQTINIQAVVDSDDSNHINVEASDSKLDDPLPHCSYIEAKVRKALQDLPDDVQAESASNAIQDLEITNDVNDQDHSRQLLIDDIVTHVKAEDIEIDLDAPSESQSFDSDDFRSVRGDTACAKDVKPEVRSSCRNDTDSCPAHTRLLEAILSCVSRQEQSAARAAHAQEAQARALERIALVLEDRQRL